MPSNHRRPARAAPSTRARRVVVAMSGGVDSSVVAALLKREGHDVVGVTLQLYDHGEAIGRRGSCCAGQDIHDARRVADKLGIPHYVLDYEARFRAGVMQAFADSYAAGETPDPVRDLQPADQVPRPARDRQGAGRATGWRPATTSSGATARAGPELYRARDAERDQSYFLFATTRAQLAALMFPLGGDGARARCGRWPAISACPSPTRPTARTSASSRRGATPASSSASGPAPRRPARSCMSTAACSGATTASSTTPSASAAGFGVPAAEPLYVVRLDTGRRQVVVGPRESLLHALDQPQGRELAGRRPARRCGPGRRGAHPLHRPAAAGHRVLLTAAGCAVLLRDGEYGVAAGPGLRVLCRYRPRARACWAGGGSKAPRASRAPSGRTDRAAAPESWASRSCRAWEGEWP